MEHRDGNGAQCVLTFQNDTGSVVFEWQQAGPAVVTVADQAWRFSSNGPLPVAMRVGDTWLSNGGNSAVLEAEAHGNAVTFPVRQPVEALLGPADRIEVLIKGARLTLALDRERIGPLLDRTRQCREVIRH